MEIEVGEYVKTKNGEIHKIIEINNPNDELWTYYKFENNMGNYKENIVKHSKNIIDLIEERRLCEWKICKKNKPV